LVGFPGPSSDSRARFCLMVALVWLALVLVGARVDAQLSSALGGDLAGKPSLARVEKIRGFPTLPNTPTTGDVWKWNGSAWGPDVDQVGEGGEGGLTSLRLWTLSPTASYVVNGTENTTIASFTIPGTAAVTNTLHFAMLSGTYRITESVSMFVRLYANGNPCQVNNSLSMGSNIQRRYCLRWSYGLTTTPGFDECVEQWAVALSDGGQLPSTYDSAFAGLLFPFPYAVGPRNVHATDPIFIEIAVMCTVAARRLEIYTDQGFAYWLP
jgi:hypothetical protein